MRKKILFWMNCYGSWDLSLRSVKEMIGYDQYLNAVIRSIEIFKKEIIVFWISGGMLDILQRTECQTVKPELEKRLQKNQIKIKINTDEESITSAMVMRKFLLTWKTSYSSFQPIIFVDQVRYEINCYVCEQYCKEMKIKNLTASNIIPISRIDSHPDSSREKQQEKLALMKDKGIPYVEALAIKARKKD